MQCFKRNIARIMSWYKSELLRFILALILLKPLQLAWALLSNALLGWGDDKIGARLGMTSPGTQQVADVFFKWAFPFGLSGIVIWLIFKVVLYLASKERNGAKGSDAVSMASAINLKLRDATTGASFGSGEVNQSDMAAYDVLKYIVMDAKWGHEIAEKKGRKVGNQLTIFEAINEFQRAAGQGEVKAIGRLAGKGTHVPIPNVFWHTSTLDASSLEKSTPMKTRPADAEQDGIPIYTSVRVLSCGVYSAWLTTEKSDTASAPAKPRDYILDVL
jgi:hypothetical protein